MGNYRSLLTEHQVLAWARAHRRRTGRWPQITDGPVLDAEADEDWANIDKSLRVGTRGLPGGDSLPHLLNRKLGARNRMAPPRLTLDQVRRWALAHEERTGHWPHPQRTHPRRAGGELARRRHGASPGPARSAERHHPGPAAGPATGGQ
jgi:hypothetical protein